jgi:hypothetical protein
MIMAGLRNKGDRSATAALQAEILTRTRLHTEMVRRLVNDPTVQPIELAGFLEDVANAYLSISEELSQIVKAAEGR